MKRFCIAFFKFDDDDDDEEDEASDNDAVPDCNDPVDAEFSSFQALGS